MGTEVGTWTASEYEKGIYKPHIKFHAQTIKSTLTNSLGPLKHLVQGFVRSMDILDGPSTKYIRNITKDEEDFGSSRLTGNMIAKVIAEDIYPVQHHKTTSDNKSRSQAER